MQSTNEQVLLNPLIYSLFMYSEDLMRQMLAAMPKGQYPSINKDDIENFVLPVPLFPEQQTILTQIAEYEAEIAKLEQNLQSLPKRKQEVLGKYLI